MTFPVQLTKQADAQSSATLAKLATLAVKGRAPKTGYDRSRFGVAWTDDVTVADGHNGCDTRNDILGRDLVAAEIKPGSNGCAVLSGTLRDPYTDTTVEFHRGDGTSSKVQIDHVVALSHCCKRTLSPSRKSRYGMSFRGDYMM